MVEVNTLAAENSPLNSTASKYRLLLAWESAYLSAQGEPAARSSDDPRSSVAGVSALPPRAAAESAVAFAPGGEDAGQRATEMSAPPHSPMRPAESAPHAQGARQGISTAIGAGHAPLQPPALALRGAAPPRPSAPVVLPQVIMGAERQTAWISRSGNDLNVWLRLPTDVAARGESILASLRTTLSSLGFRLSSLTINGELVGPSGKSASTPSSKFVDRRN